MKKIILVAICILLSLLLNAQKSNEYFYYYQDEKIFLQQKEDKIFLKLVPNVSREQVNSILKSNESLQTKNRINLDEAFSNLIILETSNAASIASETLESYKIKPEIVSATYMLEYNGALQGFRSEILW